MASLHFPAISTPTTKHQTCFFASKSPLLVSPSPPLNYLHFQSFRHNNSPKLGLRPGTPNNSAIKMAFGSDKREPMIPPYTVVITGSTKGIGYAFAREFLKAGDSVVISSRSAERVESATQTLREEFGELRVWGITCDVREGKDVKELVSFARDKLQYVDIWINNAGSNAYSYRPLAETSDEDLIEVVTTNTLGLMICCREAMNMMLNQPRGGHIFNMDGAGSDGRPTPRFAAYGATKRSVVHLTKSLQAELRMQDVKNVVAHNLSEW